MPVEGLKPVSKAIEVSGSISDGRVIVGCVLLVFVAAVELLEIEDGKVNEGRTVVVSVQVVVPVVTVVAYAVVRFVPVIVLVYYLSA